MNSKDDQVLQQLYKKGAKQAPPSELDQKILDYAANQAQDKRGKKSFSGNWKVPLSLAASVVLVFALLVQLDKNYPLLEVPSASDDALMKEIDSESSVIQPSNKLETKKDIQKNEKKSKSLHKEDAIGSVMTNGPVSEGIRLNQEHKEKYPQDKEAAPSTGMAKQRTAQEPVAKTLDEASVLEEEIMLSHRSVEDWLLMIEKLIARKDYAEAARQLEKFKQAHPIVNVEDIESKIP